MSSTAIPKTFGERPPFRGGPPVATTFDGGSADGGDRERRVEALLESAERLLKTVERTPVEDYPLLLRLLEQRRSWIRDELWARRAISAAPLPPIHGFDLDGVIGSPDPLEQRYVSTLDKLEDAILVITLSMDMQDCPFPLSEL